MCCCTYLNDSERIQEPLQNRHITEWLGKAVSLTGEGWLVKEYAVTHRRFHKWRWKDEVTYSYSLLCPTKLPEYQEINFYRDDTDWSINLKVRAELIVSYLIGICAGYQKRNNEVTAALV